MILCGGSATDLPKQTAEYARMFNVIDSFDTHAKIPEHYAKCGCGGKRSRKDRHHLCRWDPEHAI